MTEPTREEVVAWMERTGSGASDAVKHFWPSADPARARALHSTVRSWRHRRQQPPRAQRAAPNRQDPPDEERPPPDYETARLDDVRFAEWQLAELITDMAVARRGRKTQLVASLNAQVSETRDRLVAARYAAGQDGDLEETPEAIARRILARQRELHQLEGAGERREAVERKDRNL